MLAQVLRSQDSIPSGKFRQKAIRMKMLLKALVLVAAFAGYALALRYVVPSSEPWFLLGIGIVALAAAAFGIPAGVATAVLLLPLTTLVYEQFAVSTSYAGMAESPAYIVAELSVAVVAGLMRTRLRRLAERSNLLAATSEHLQNSLSQVQELGGVHNLCSSCKSIQDDDGQWLTVDAYLKLKTKMEFSHCLCPACAGHFRRSIDPDEEQDRAV